MWALFNQFYQLTIRGCLNYDCLALNISSLFLSPFLFYLFYRLSSFSKPYKNYAFFIYLCLIFCCLSLTCHELQFFIKVLLLSFLLLILESSLRYFYDISLWEKRVKLLCFSEENWSFFKSIFIYFFSKLARWFRCLSLQYVPTFVKKP